MIKVNKRLPRGKAISSYFLSGVNIKKMIYDELNTQLTNVSDANIVRVSKRPIFRIKSKQSEKENESEMVSLPNKSFKIRSFTRKLGDQSAIKLMQGSDEIFDKIENVRNFKSISNRIDLFSRIRDQQPECMVQKTSIKMKEILRVEAALKCRMSNQIFIRQNMTPRKYESVSIQFDKFDLGRYSELANRINISFNDKYKEENVKKMLLVVSMEVLQINNRRWLKGNLHDERSLPINNLQKHERVGIAGTREQIQLIRTLTETDGIKDEMNMRVVFKVQSQSELQQLKTILQRQKINKYFCIFYPIKKYSENWSLYQLDPLLNNSTRIVIFEARHKIHEEFPVVGPDCEIAFVTVNENLLSVSRAIAALKHTQTWQRKKEMLYLSPLIEDLDETQEQTTQVQKKISTICQERRKVRLHQNSQVITDEVILPQKMPQFQVKSQSIMICLRSLKAKLKFLSENKQLKFCCKKSEQKEGTVKRRVLFQQQQNTTTSRQAIDRVINLYKNEDARREGDRIKSMDEIRQTLSSTILNEEQIIINHTIASEKSSKRIQIGQKSDDLEQISNYAKGCMGKIINNIQLISETVKRNQHIYNQINSYYQKTKPLRQLGLRMEPQQINEQAESLLMKIHIFV